MSMTEVLDNVKRAIRDKYVWPGGYPVYTVMADGEMLCAKCARGNYRLIAQATRNDPRSDWAAVGADVLWESDGETCAHCGDELQAAYGD
jgi:hypothetical protein